MRKEDRKVSPPIQPKQEELLSETTLRPKVLDEFIGQHRIKENLKVFIAAARMRKEPLDHILFCGPPGLGKTTLSTIIANELLVNIKTTTGPVLEKVGDLAAILTNLSDRDILFIDEIHRIPRAVEEVLYPAMEDFTLDIIIGQGPNARTLKLNLPKFTLIGATTRTGLLSSPLRDRFGVIFRLDFYTPQELVQIVHRSSKLLNVKIEEEASLEIAKRSRGTPRIANRLLKRIRDFAQVMGEGIIDLNITKKSLASLDIDNYGLDELDRKFLHILIDKFNGGPVGIEALAAALREDKETLEDVYEPYLLQEGFIERTARGRLATDLAYKHLGKRSPQSLF
ncbi:MAG: Holliday junction branch migration DNA helicase RuvB [Thermodesulfovibrionales bacterium]|nr:Holliday junction branch migration DNA helicase RuvB [Thermodesulfovibrionales bacterium]